MALETGTYIDSLVSSNPPQSDSLTQAAGHLRLLKSTLLATFPNVTGAVTGTHTALNTAATGAAAGGFVPTAGVIDYYGTSEPSGWLWANGQAVSRTTYAALFTAISTTHGVGDGSTTFNVPNYKDRMSIGRATMGSTTDAAIIDSLLDTTTLGATYDGEGAIDTITLTATELPAHTHTFTGSSASTSSGGGSHTHGDGSYSTDTYNHSHSYGNAGGTSTVARGSGSNFTYANASSGTTGSDSHSHGVTGNSGSTNIDHTHTVTATGTNSSTGSGTAFTVAILPPTIVCNKIIKT